MDEKELKGLLMQRLNIELMLFKDSMLQKGKEEIFGSSYEMEMYVCLYEILAGHVDGMEGSAIRRVLKLNPGILGTLYRGWLKQEDSLFEELKDYACGALEVISGKEKQDREDGGNGKNYNKAAESGRD